MDYLTPTSRSRIVRHETRFDQRGHLDPRLRRDVIKVANITSVWEKLNGITGGNQRLAEASQIIFSGQQPTLALGTDKKLPKIIAQIRDGVLCYSHADHDRAGKSGFDCIEIPVVRDGQIAYEQFTLNGGVVDPTAIMKDTKVPDFEAVESLLLDIAVELEKVGEFLEIETQSELMNECIGFLGENYADIRSLAELNAVINAYLIARLVPGHQTINFMLSDLFESESGRLALAEQLLDMPGWIQRYNSSLGHVRETEYKDQHMLPKPLNSWEYAGVGYYELPMWILENTNEYLGRERHRAIVAVGPDGGLVYGYKHDGNNGKSEFKQLLTIPRGTDIAELANASELSNISPGALALTDILRNRLQLSVIHGGTGHIYDSISEVMKHLEICGELPGPGRLPIVNDQSSFSTTVAARSFSPKRRFESRRISDNLKERLRSIHDQIYQLEEQEKFINSRKGEYYGRMRTVQILVEELASPIKLDSRLIDLEITKNSLQEISSFDPSGKEPAFAQHFGVLEYRGKRLDIRNLFAELIKLFIKLGVGKGEEAGLLRNLGLNDLATLWKKLNQQLDLRDYSEKLIELDETLVNLIADITSLRDEAGEIEDYLEREQSVIEMAILSHRHAKAIRRHAGMLLLERQEG